MVHLYNFLCCGLVHESHRNCDLTMRFACLPPRFQNKCNQKVEKKQKRLNTKIDKAAKKKNKTTKTASSFMILIKCLAREADIQPSNQPTS